MQSGEKLKVVCYAYHVINAAGCLNTVTGEEEFAKNTALLSLPTTRCTVSLISLSPRPVLQMEFDRYAVATQLPYCHEEDSKH